MQAPERLAELAAAYVLGALQADEMVQAEALLATDPAFRQAVAEARDAIELLPYAVPTWTPPQHLRAAVLGRIATLAEQSFEAPREQPPAPSWLARLWERSGPWLSSWSPALTAASVGLVLVLAFISVATRHELDLERETLARTAPQATAGALVMSAVMSPRSTAVPLLTPTVAPSTDTMVATQSPPQGRMLVDHDGGRVLLVVRYLPPLPRQRVYRAWTVATGQRPLALGSVQVSDDGTGILVAPLPQGAERLRDLMVTIEPDADGDAPTMPPVVAASF